MHDLKETGQLISIHAPARGGDVAERGALARCRHFNPRPREGGRPGQVHILHRTGNISIHAPREGGDSVAAEAASQQ